jgi:hypothetical protein
MVLTGHTLRSLARAGLVLLVALLALFAGAMRTAPAFAVTPLLPDLVADPPDNVSLATDSSTGASRLLLRFDGYVHNKGPGALDFRGSRSAPKVSKETEEEVLRAWEKHEGLPQKTEEEEATPPMGVFQRLFTTNVEETNIERPHEDVPSSGEMIYVSADGHHHWHLQRVAKYSLWNSTKTAEVAPAQKVGFCLEDSQHVEAGIGPESPVYADNVAPYRAFCKEYRPDATSLYEGISPGWRDLYERELAFQWVDASNVLPGEYWLREDVNPLGVIQETGGENQPAYATKPTIVPGFDALAQTIGAQAGVASTVTLTSQAWSDLATPRYAIVTQPQHGTLGTVEADHVTYTPQPGYSGTDAFTFSTADPNSQFPQSPAVATVSVEVAVPPQPSVSIGGAPATMLAGTSVELTATVAHDSGGVEWIASAGTFTVEGAEGLKTSYVAPSESPSGGTVTVTARLKDDHAVSDQRTIAIAAARPPEAAPEVPSTSVPGDSGGSKGAGSSPPPVSHPRVMLIGRKLIMTTFVAAAGRIRLSAYLGRRRLGTCMSRTPADRTFTCRLTLGAGVSLRSRISVLASLRIGRRIIQSLRPAAQIAQMSMAGASGLRHGGYASSARFWCSPSMPHVLASASFAAADAGL